jgi:hypothetical protein
MVQKLQRKWLIESQTDGEESAFRILEARDEKAELRYIAMDVHAAKELVTALNWFDSFMEGRLSVPGLAVKPKPRPAPKPKTVVVELELEQPKKPRRKT